MSTILYTCITCDIFILQFLQTEILDYMAVIVSQPKMCNPRWKEVWVFKGKGLNLEILFYVNGKYHLITNLIFKSLNWYAFTQKLPNACARDIQIGGVRLQTLIQIWIIVDTDLISDSVPKVAWIWITVLIKTDLESDNLSLQHVTSVLTWQGLFKTH